MKLYKERDIENQMYYGEHVSAMTGEKLHSKSAIAAELAHRDEEIEDLKFQVSHLNGLYQDAMGTIQNFKTPEAERTQEIQAIIPMDPGVSLPHIQIVPETPQTTGKITTALAVEIENQIFYLDNDTTYSINLAIKFILETLLEAEKRKIK